MEQAVVFGDSMISARLPDDTKVISPGLSAPLEAVDDLGAEVTKAISHPIDTAPLRDLAKGKRRVLVAFDDATVPCYAPLWQPAVEAILRELASGGVNDEGISLLCANALHRKFTPEELSSLIGIDLVQRFGDQVSCHDAEDPQNIINLGTTPSGYPVELNKAVSESDLVIYLNCSTTRGFSGGWKSIAVGLSTYASIRTHHTPSTMSMSMDRNRMHEILDEMGELIEQELGRERFFKVETVLANPLQVAKVFGGSVGATRKAALDLNKSKLPRRRDLLDEKADIVAYGVPDWSPYAAFSFTNPLLTLISTGLGYLGGMIEALGKPGCTVILATPCPDRWDEVHHPSYKEVWERVLPVEKDPNRARETFEEEMAHRPEYIDSYRNRNGFHGSHGIMALYPLRRLEHAGRVIVAGAENPALATHLGFSSTTTIEDAVDEARGTSAGGSVAFVPYPPAINRT